MRKERTRFKIGEAKEEDLNELVKVYLEGYKGLEEYSYTHPEDVIAYIKWLWRRDPEGVFVARSDSKIIGFVAGDSNWFSKREQKRVGGIHEIVVLPEHQGMGVGRALMERVLDYFRSKGLELAELWVGDKNHKAIEFYKKLGFKEHGQYNYWVRMTLSLT